MRNINWTQPPRAIGLREIIVWVDVAKAEEAWQRHQLYVPPGAPLSLEKYFKFGRWLDGFAGAVHMPEADMYRGTLGFANGRHRFAWMRDHGARAIPMSMSRQAAKIVAKHLGTDLRTCDIVRRSVHSARLRIPSPAP